VPSTTQDNMRDCGLGQAGPCKVEATATRLMAEAGMMMPTSDSDGTFLPKVSGVLLLRMSLHWQLCATTLLYHSRTRIGN